MCLVLYYGLEIPNKKIGILDLRTTEFSKVNRQIKE